MRMTAGVSIEGQSSNKDIDGNVGQRTVSLGGRGKPQQTSNAQHTFRPGQAPTITTRNNALLFVTATHARRPQRSKLFISLCYERHEINWPKDVCLLRRIQLAQRCVSVKTQLLRPPRR